MALQKTNASSILAANTPQPGCSFSFGRYLLDPFTIAVHGVPVCTVQLTVSAMSLKGLKTALAWRQFILVRGEEIWSPLPEAFLLLTETFSRPTATPTRSPAC